MGYTVNKTRKRNDDSWGWRVLWQSMKDGALCKRHVPESEYRQAGFSRDWTLDEARGWAKKLNAEGMRKHHEGARNRIQARLKAEDRVECIHLPPPLALKFENRLAKDYEDNERQLGRVMIHWRTAKRIIRAVDLPLEQWNESPKSFYRHFSKNRVSWEYVKKLIRILNAWGYFLARETGLTFQPLPFPKAHEKQKIRDAYRAAGKTKASARITAEQLKSKETKMEPEHFKWVYLSLWCGLRPSEIDRMKDNPESWKLTYETDGMPILWVFQEKLTSIDWEQRWKLIPLQFSEQQKCIELIQSGAFTRPLAKTMRKHFGPKVTTYAGRKSFEDLMATRGQDEADISNWLGHSTIRTTRQHYANRLRPRYKKAA